MLNIGNLSIKLNDSLILDSIDLTILPGAICSIVGPNGAGKSTLLRTLVGLLSPHQGSIIYENTNILQVNSKTRARSIAYLPQSMPGNQRFPVYDFVALGNYPRAGFDDPQELRERIENALRVCQIEAFRSREVSSLSGGERQRVYLAQVIVQKTPIILLDEPTVFLDLKHQVLFEDILLQLKDENKHIIYVSHDLHSARRIATHIVALKDGRIMIQGKPDEVMNPDLIAELFDTSRDVIKQWYGNGWIGDEQ